MRTSSARPWAAALITALALTLTGCSGDDAPDTATDPASDDRDPGTSETSEAPSSPPTVGTYPGFAPEDYAFTLRVTCFCPDAGVPVRVTVAGGEITSAVYAERSRGIKKGAPAPEHLSSVTIDDVIDQLNAATEAEKVDVDWPEGQDFPSSVYIDQSSRISDEEIGYAISDVVVA